MNARVRMAAAAVLVTAGAIASMGSPRLTLSNAGLIVEYPWFRGLGAIVAAGGAMVVFLSVQGRWKRAAALTLAAVGLGVGLHLLAYRLEADAEAISFRGLGGRRVIAWPSVSRVEGGPGVILVVGADENRIDVDTTDFSPDQRASIERTIARRIKDLSKQVR